MPLHAFADESRRGPSYLITVVTIPPGSLDAVRRGRWRRPARQPPHPPVGRDRSPPADDPPCIRAAARDRCLAIVLSTCRDQGVVRLTLDTRLPDRDRLDRRTIAAALRTLAPYDLDYLHRGSRDEPLLSLPDAIGWAWGAGGDWRRIVAPVIGSVSRCDRA